MIYWSIIPSLLCFCYGSAIYAIVAFRSLSAFNLNLQVHEFRFLFIAFVSFFCRYIYFCHNLDFGFGWGFVGISFLDSTFVVPVFLHFGFVISVFHHIWCPCLSTFCCWHFSFGFHFSFFFPRELSSNKSRSVKGQDSKI